jgi:Ca-activated chloride channel family protein
LSLRRIAPVLGALLGSLALALAASRGASAQAPSPRPTGTPRPLTFGTGIEVINLNVSVMDRESRFVTDLNQPDFAVFEDGIRQELSLFTRENLPISLSVLIDTSASMDEKLKVAQTAATRFVKTLRAEDSAQVIQFNDRVLVLQDFSADHAQLEAAIKRTTASGPTSLYNALYIALKDLTRLKKEQGDVRRLAVVMLTDGEDTASLITDEQVLELARKSEIAIYPISLRGNTPQDRERLAFSQATHFVTTLARDTGGSVQFPNSISELDRVYERIAEELRTQYSIGYVSNNRRRDGKWRRIVVRTPDRESLQVRHKLGYYAPAT